MALVQQAREDQPCRLAANQRSARITKVTFLYGTLSAMYHYQRRPLPVRKLLIAMGTLFLLTSCATTSLPTTSALVGASTRLLKQQSYRSEIQGAITFDAGHITGSPSMVSAIQAAYRHNITETGTITKNRAGQYFLQLKVTDQGSTRQTCAIETRTILYYSTTCTTYTTTTANAPSPPIYRYTPLYLLSAMHGPRETGRAHDSQGAATITISGTLGPAAISSVITATAASLGFSNLAPDISVSNSLATVAINLGNDQPTLTTLQINMTIMIAPLLQDLVNNAGTGKPIPTVNLPHGILRITEIITTHPGGFGIAYPIHIP